MREKPPTVTRSGAQPLKPHLRLAQCSGRAFRCGPIPHRKEMPYKDPERMKEYQKEWMRARRATYLAGKACVKCGATERLEIDHINPAEKESHHIWSWAEERRSVELAKCQILCNACHKLKTREDQRVFHEHGTYGRYKTDRCRCDACRAANASATRRRRAPWQRNAE